MKLRLHSTKSHKAKRITAISFTAEDLTSLGQLIAAGQVMLQTSCPAVTRLKAAMTRMGVSVPKGL